MRGIADGFFIPLYFVVLGAQLDLGGLFDHPSMLALAGSLAALNVLIHVIAVALTRKPVAAGLAASAQLGVPAAIASLGLSEHVLSAEGATAIIAAALVSLGVCTLGVERLIRHEAEVMPVPETGLSGTTLTCRAIFYAGSAVLATARGSTSSEQRAWRCR